MPPVLVIASLISPPKPWYYWVGLVLTLVAILSVIGVFVGYLVNVVRPQYPKTSQRRPAPRR
jgi:hypothetical protein